MTNRSRDVEVGAGQQLDLARRNPALGLILMASRAAAVLAGVVGVDLAAAVIAAPQVSAERVRPAGKNVGDGTPMRGQHRRAMPRQIVVREPAEDVSECD